MRSRVHIYDSHTHWRLEAKDRMCARRMVSPDEWDVVVLTSAEPVAGVSKCRRVPISSLPFATLALRLLPSPSQSSSSSSQATGNSISGSMQTNSG